MTSPALNLNPPVGLVYLVVNKLNGKIYIGQTTGSLANRWRSHVYNARWKPKYPIHYAIKKYGADNFRVTVLAEASSRDELNALEVCYIAGLGTLRPNGYNLDLGGRSYGIHPETRAKISAAAKGRPSHRKGKKHKPESIEKMRISKKGSPPTRLGHHHTEEAKAKLSAARKGKPGHPHTEEFKEALSRRNLGNSYTLGLKQSPEHLRKRIESYKRTVQKRRENALRSQCVNPVQK